MSFHSQDCRYSLPACHRGPNILLFMLKLKTHTRHPEKFNRSKSIPSPIFALFFVAFIILILAFFSDFQLASFRENIEGEDAAVNRTSMTLDQVVPVTLRSRTTSPGAHEGKIQAMQQQQQHPPIKIAPFPRPQNCSVQQFAALDVVLPETNCKKKNFKCASWKCLNRCAIVRNTACPQATWFDRYYLQQQNVHRHHFRSIYVGCNKAFDAIETMSKLTKDPAFNKTIWMDVLVEASGLPRRKFRGVCKQDQASMESAAAKNTFFRWASAQLFCIEALPATAVALQAAVSKLNLHEKGFQIVPAAISRQDGKAQFPKSSKDAGREDLGIDYCSSNNSSNDDLCEEVPVYSIDTFINQKWNSTEIIQFLSIDVEGYDLEVLLGGIKELQRVEYVEFEYHRIGSWINYPLSAAIDPLDSIGFTCYWAGSGGKLWRITGCYRNVYNYHYWSNVACVNRELVPVLAEQMEKRFLNETT